MGAVPAESYSSDPARVVTAPNGVNLRIRRGQICERYTLPPASTAIPPVWVYLPATWGIWANVVMVPARSTLRIRWLSSSAMKRFPRLSKATPEG